MSDLGLPFEARVRELPRLGLGISTEFGARHGGLDPIALRRSRPELLGFLEIGADLARGADSDALAWVGEGWPCTYHFLDVNLEERESLDPEWIAHVRAAASKLGAAWLCGDAGLWHLGRRERGHGVLMPPVLDVDSAQELADNVRQLRLATGFEVLPENPPAHLYLGDMHILDYFARVAELADCGLLLDVAHLAIHQQAVGCALFEGLERFPLERVVEIHIAGGREFSHQGRRFIDDDHGPEPLPQTWQLLEAVLPRATNLRALVFECERNPLETVLPGFERLSTLLDWSQA